MAGNIKTFEDLIAWQKARELTKAVYRMTAAKEFNRDFSLKDQMRRASVSVMSNIAEGFDRGGRAEFHQFLVIAKASCDAGYIKVEHFKQMVLLNQEVSRIIAGLRKAVQHQRKSFTKPLVLSP